MALVLLVVLALGVGIAAPFVVAGLVRSGIEDAAASSIEGSVVVGDVSAGWTGPIGVDELVLRDPQGTEVARVSARTDRGMLPLALGAIGGNLDLGTITVSGQAILERAGDGELTIARALKARPSGAAPRPTGAPSPAGSGGGSGGGGELPTGLRATLDITGVDVLVRDGQQAVAGLRGVSGGGVIDIGSPISLSFKATPVTSATPITLTVRAENYADAAGALTAGSAEVVVTLDAAVPDAEIDAGVRALTGVVPPVTGGPSGGQTTASIALKVSGGRITLHEGRALAIEGAIPPALVASATGYAGGALELDPGARFGVRIDQLNAPVEGAKGDWRGAALDASMALEGVSGGFQMGANGPSDPAGAEASGGRLTPFAVSARPARIVLDPGTGLLTVDGGGSATIDGEPAGTMSLDAEIGDALAGDGSIATELPGILRAALEVDGVMTDAPWIAMVERLTGAPIAAVLGERATLSATAALPSSEQRTGTVEILGGITLDSPRTRAGIGFAVSTNGVRADGEGVSISTSAAAPVLRAMGIELSGEGYRGELSGTTATVSIPAFFVPIVDRGPDLGGSSGEAIVEVRDARGTLIADRSVPVDLQLLRLTATLRPDQPAEASLVGTAAADGAPIGINGRIVVPDPDALLADDGAGGAVALAKSGFAGDVRLEGLPMRLAALVDAALGEQLDAAMGERVDVTAEVSDWAPDSAGSDAVRTLLTLTAEGGRGRLKGAADVTMGGESLSVATRGDGFQLLLREPQRLVDTLELEGMSLDVGGPLAVYLVDVDASIGGGEAATPEVRSAKVEVRAPRVAARIDPVEGSQGQASTITLRDTAIDLTLDAEGWGDLAIRSGGDADGQALSMDGSIGVRGALARAMDPAGFLGSSAPLETRGSWTVSGLSGGVLRVLDPALPGVADAAAPAPIRLEVVASRTGPEGVEPGAGAGGAIEAPGFVARVVDGRGSRLGATRVALDGSRLVVGPTVAGVRIDRELIRRGAALAEIDPAGVPAPVDPFAIDARVTTLRYPLVDGGSIDPLDPEGGYEATVTAGPGDVVLRLPEGAGSAGGMAVGIRGLRAFRRVAPGDASASGQGLVASFFDPQDGNASLGSIDASAGVDDLSSVRVLGEGLRLGQIARRLGLGDAPALALGEGATRIELRGGAAGGGDGSQRVRVDADVRAPRLSVAGVAGYDTASGRMGIIEPMSLSWDLDRRFVDRFVFGDEPLAGGSGGDSGAPLVRLSSDVRVEGAIEALDLVLADEAAGRAMSFNSATARLKTGAITLVPVRGQPAQLGSLALNITPEAGRPGVLALSLRSDATVGGASGGGAGGSGATPLSADGRVRVPTVDRAGEVTLTARGDLPTLAIDAIARSGQTLAALLGDRTRFEFSADGLATDLSSGGIRAALDSANAAVRLRGAADDGKLVIGSVPGDSGAVTEARLSILTPDASRELFRPLFPIFSSIQKRSTDRPTLLSVERLSLPMTGDIAGVSGRFSLDLGEVNFETPPIVGSVLKATGGREAGTIGTELAPVVVTIEDGVASYEPWAIPIGEFTLHLSGRVNLATQRVDEMMLYVPIGALAAEFSSQFSRLPVIGRISTAAFRLSGPIDALKLEPVLDPATLLKIQGVGGGPGGGSGDPVRDLIREGLREGLRESGKIDERTGGAIDDLLRGIGRPRRDEGKKEEPPAPDEPKEDGEGDGGL